MSRVAIVLADDCTSFKILAWDDATKQFTDPNPRYGSSLASVNDVDHYILRECQKCRGVDDCFAMLCKIRELQLGEGISCYSYSINGSKHNRFEIPGSRHIKPNDASNLHFDFFSKNYEFKYCRASWCARTLIRYMDQRFYNSQNEKDYREGLNYANRSWTDTTWLYNYLTMRNNKPFNEGIEEANTSEILRQSPYSGDADFTWVKNTLKG
jgi:hypothetical protein